MYDEALLRILAREPEGLRPFPIPGWVHNGHWMARSDAKADGRPPPLDAEAAGAFIAKHLDAEREPLEHVGFVMRTTWVDGTGDGVFCRLYESAAGVVAINDDYAALLDGLTVVHLLTDVREASPVGGIDDLGVVQCWIMPMAWARMMTLAQKEVNDADNG